MIVEEKALETVTKEYMDIISYTDAIGILDTMLKDCVENVHGELSLVVSCGEIVSAKSIEAKMLTEEK
jgi:hypothetical protein